jgi:hypothetical protein
MKKRPRGFRAGLGVNWIVLKGTVPFLLLKNRDSPHFAENQKAQNTPGSAATEWFTAAFVTSYFAIRCKFTLQHMLRISQPKNASLGCRRS